MRTTRAGSGSDSWRREESEGEETLETSESLVSFPPFDSWSQILLSFVLRIQFYIPHAPDRTAREINTPCN